MHCRVFHTNSLNPYQNLAAEELILNSTEADELVLYLWQNANTVVVGRNQNAWRECKLEALQKESGHLARRLSGGGAVYHDLGNQNFTFFARKKDYNTSRHIEILQKALQYFGICAQASGRNDMTVDGRKFSGHAYYQSGDYCYHHGTLLLSADMGKMQSFLNPSPQKLAGKGVASVSARVVNLCEYAKDLTPKLMQEALVEALGKVCGTKPIMASFGSIDAGTWAKATEKYASDAWRLGKPLVYTASFVGALSFGELEVQLLIKEGKVEQAKVYSDAMDETLAQRLGACLQNVSFDAEAQCASIQQAFMGEAEVCEQLQSFMRQNMRELGKAPKEAEGTHANI